MTTTSSIGPNVTSVLAKHLLHIAPTVSYRSVAGKAHKGRGGHRKSKCDHKQAEIFGTVERGISVVHEGIRAFAISVMVSLSLK